MSKKLIGKPVFIDKLDPELGGKVVKLVMDDMERATRERQKAQGSPQPSQDQSKAT